MNSLNSILNSIRNLALKLRALFPSAMPIGLAEHKAWADSIISLYDFPDNDSVRFALATMVLHLGPTAAYRSKFYFSIMLKAGAAKQVASAVFQEIKIKQQAEVTAQTAVPSSASPI